MPVGEKDENKGSNVEKGIIDLKGHCSIVVWRLSVLIRKPKSIGYIK